LTGKNGKFLARVVYGKSRGDGENGEEDNVSNIVVSWRYGMHEPRKEATRKICGETLSGHKERKGENIQSTK